MRFNLFGPLRLGLPLIMLAVFLHPVFAGIRPSFSLDYCSWHATHIVLVEVTQRDGVFRVIEPWKGELQPEDDPAGQPPFFRADAGLRGDYELATLAEPHRIRVSAPGYRPLILEIGRAWFIWIPRGKEKKNIELMPFNPSRSRI